MGDSLATVNLGTNRRALHVVAHTSHTCARLDDRTVKCWGYNGLGQLGQGDIDDRGDEPDEMGDNLPGVELCKDSYAVCEGADALVIVTEWNQFRMLDLARVKALLRRPVIVDLRNIYSPASMREAGYTYISVGR